MPGGIRSHKKQVTGGQYGGGPRLGLLIKGGEWTQLPVSVHIKDNSVHTELSFSQIIEAFWK
jgi:hypothetical protein